VRTIKVALKRSLNHYREANTQLCEQFEQMVDKLVHTVWCAVNRSRLLNTVLTHPEFVSDNIKSQTDMQRLGMQCFQQVMTYSSAVQKPCQSLEDI
jgi:hypothetical protein